MGNTIRILSEVSFPHGPFFKDLTRMEIAECFHVHWRDLRILMDRDQFNSFCETVEASSSISYGMKFGNDTLLDQGMIPNSLLFDGEAKIEEVEGGVFHFHYNEMRLELDQTNLVKLCNLFSEARRKLCFDKQSVLLPMSDINPYDHCHFPNPSEWSSKEDYDKHYEGSILFEKRVREGYQIKPIIVTNLEQGRFKYQRRDGFKRYLAYLFLGLERIPAYIVSEDVALTCPQDGVYPFLQEGAFE